MKQKPKQPHNAEKDTHPTSNLQLVYSEGATIDNKKIKEIDNLQQSNSQVPKLKNNSETQTSNCISQDIKYLKKTKLYKKYEGEYNSWRNMKQRCKEQQAVLDPRFKDFTYFLQRLGPKPAPTYTLDRIDHNNPEYSPENTRWASKSLQSQNRKSAVYLTDSTKGITLPLTEWAKLLNIKPATIRSRLHRKYSDQEALYGRDKRDKGDKGDNKYKNNPMWDLLSSHVPAHKLESRYLKAEKKIRRHPPLYINRKIWLHKLLSQLIDHTSSKILSIHDPYQPEEYPVPPDLAKNLELYGELLKQVESYLSDRERQYMKLDLFVKHLGYV